MGAANNIFSVNSGRNKVKNKLDEFDFVKNFKFEHYPVDSSAIFARDRLVVKIQVDESKYLAYVLTEEKDIKELIQSLSNDGCYLVAKIDYK